MYKVFESDSLPRNSITQYAVNDLDKQPTPENYWGGGSSVLKIHLEINPLLQIVLKNQSLGYIWSNIKIFQLNPTVIQNEFLD